jgi:hypothetical protein
MAVLGQLTVDQEVCLQREVPHAGMRENQAWVLWLARWRRTQDTALRDQGAVELLATAQVPDRVLWVAELLLKENPTLAEQALERAESMALQWSRLSTRIEQLQKVFQLRSQLEPKETPIRWAQTWNAMGVTGPYLDTALTACRAVASEEVCLQSRETTFLSLGKTGDFQACQNVTHLWVQRMGKRAYSTERDCLIHVAYLMPEGPEKHHLMQWALILSMSRDEHYVTGAAMRLLAPSVLSDRNTILTAVDFHRKQGDKAGAAWWESRLK